MKKLSFLLSVIALTWMLNVNESNAQVVVRVRPIAPVVVAVRPVAPHRNWIWIDGFWRWHPGRREYIWVDGYWTKPRRGMVWAPGYWRDAPGGSIWIGGRWGRR